VKLFSLVKNFISTDYMKMKRFNVVSHFSYICFFYSYNKTTVDVSEYSAEFFLSNSALLVLSHFPYFVQSY